MRIHFRPEAAGDLTEAYRWYERQRRGLGGEFEAAVEATLGLLKQAPTAFPILHRELRRVLRVCPKFGRAPEGLQLMRISLDSATQRRLSD